MPSLHLDRRAAPRRWRPRTPSGRTVPLGVHLRQHPLTRRVLAVILAIVVFGAMWDARRAGESARTAWGTSRDVLVTARAVPAGRRMGPSDVHLVRYPIALAPVGAMASLPDGAVAATAMTAGEPIIGIHLAHSGSGAAAARLGTGSVAVAIPRDDRTPPVAEGDAVRLIAVPDGSGLTAVTLGSGRVSVVGDRSLTVVIEESATSSVVAAITRGSLTVVVAPG